MNATNFNVKLIQIENVRSKRTHKRNNTVLKKKMMKKEMYQRKHSIDNINWMIMVGQSTRIEINFDELTAAMGFRN